MKLLPFILLISLNTVAQEDKKVMEPINLLFEGMKKSDSAMVHRAFHSQVNFYSVVTDPRTNQPLLRSDALKGFLVSIGTPHKEVYNEMIWSPKIEIDDNLAQVWGSYAFYLGKTFHHCGVDAFQLFKDTRGQWKIFQLADTRQTVGCVIPDEVSDEMK